MTVKLRPTFKHTLVHPITITLKGPSGERQETITEIEVVKPKAGDMVAVDGVEGENNKELAMLAHLSGQPRRVIDELELEDLAELQKGLQAFLPGGQPTGQTS